MATVTKCQPTRTATGRHLNLREDTPTLLTTSRVNKKEVFKNLGTPKSFFKLTNYQSNVKCKSQGTDNINRVSESSMTTTDDSPSFTIKNEPGHSSASPACLQLPSVWFQSRNPSLGTSTLSLLVNAPSLARIDGQANEDDSSLDMCSSANLITMRSGGDGSSHFRCLLCQGHCLQSNSKTLAVCTRQCSSLENVHSNYLEKNRSFHSSLIQPSDICSFHTEGDWPIASAHEEACAELLNWSQGRTTISNSSPNLCADPMGLKVPESWKQMDTSCHLSEECNVTTTNRDIHVRSSSEAVKSSRQKCQSWLEKANLS